MKRDMELIRKIVLAVEESESGYAQPVVINGYTEEQIGYHNFLIADAGLAIGSNVTFKGASAPQWRLVHLTSAGHDFADAARNKSIWDKATAAVKENAGAVTIAVMTQLLVHYAKKAVGLDSTSSTGEGSP